MRSHISLFYGPSAWDEIVRMEGQMRKERKEAIYAAEERKQLIIEWLVGIGLGILFMLVMGGIFYLIGLGQRWW